MRDQEPRRYHRHDEEASGCQRSGDESRRRGEDPARRPRDGGRRRGHGRGGFPGRLSGQAPGFRGPRPWAGGEYAAAHPDDLRAPWDLARAGTRGAAMQIRALTGQLAMAASQVAAAGTDAQQAQAGQVLADSRKSLYQILADSEDEASAQEK